MLVSCNCRSLPSVWSEEQEPPVPPIPGIGEGPVILTTTSASTPVSHRESWVACGVSCSDVVVVVAAVVAVVVHAGEKLFKSKTSLPKNRVQVRISFPKRDISSFNLQVIYILRIVLVQIPPSVFFCLLTMRLSWFLKADPGPGLLCAEQQVPLRVHPWCSPRRKRPLAGWSWSTWPDMNLSTWFFEQKDVLCKLDL